MNKKTNIAQYLPDMADKLPDKKAITFRNESITFRELENISNLYAYKFSNKGIKKGTKTLVMLRPGIEFIAAVFAIFKTGGIPVLIDPGMGLKNLLNCIKQTKPSAMIGVAVAHWLRLFFPRSFKSLNTCISLGSFSPFWLPKISAASSLSENSINVDFSIVKTELDDTAALVFTTGSTGPPKGVVYTHRIYIEQMKIIGQVYGAGPDEIDMPAFPLFALFSAAMGMPCVIPDINPSLPAQVDPEVIINTIQDHKITFSFASPALWRRVCSYCQENDIQIPSLKKILMAGAPVPEELHKMVKQTFPNGETMVPYGATEALPVANFAGSEMNTSIAGRISNGEGYCVGKPLPGIEIHVIKCTEEPITQWDKSLSLPPGETGEIVIDGKIVTPEYYEMPEQNKKAKIPKKDGGIIHRMGDVGFFDKDGYLWFKGRKSHRVITEKEIMYPVCCEAIFNSHPKVFRSALVGVGEPGRQTPVIIIEPVSEILPLKPQTRQQFLEQLIDLGSKKPFTANIKNFLFFSPFPVDIRHNAKIFREKLTEWAGKRKLHKK